MARLHGSTSILTDFLVAVPCGGMVVRDLGDCAHY